MSCALVRAALARSRGALARLLARALGAIALRRGGGSASLLSLAERSYGKKWHVCFLGLVFNRCKKIMFLDVFSSGFETSYHGQNTSFTI